MRMYFFGQKNFILLLLAALLVLPFLFSTCGAQHVLSPEKTQAPAHCPLEQLHEVVGHFEFLTLRAPVVPLDVGQSVVLLIAFFVCVVSIAAAQRALRVRLHQKYKQYTFSPHMNFHSFLREVLSNGVLCRRDHSVSFG